MNKQIWEIKEINFNKDLEAAFAKMQQLLTWACRCAMNEKLTAFPSTGNHGPWFAPLSCDFKFLGATDLIGASTAFDINRG